MIASKMAMAVAMSVEKKIHGNTSDLLMFLLSVRLIKKQTRRLRFR